eukprot:2261178-Pleurochrysis_carterae.AAC.1
MEGQISDYRAMMRERERSRGCLFSIGLNRTYKRHICMYVCRVAECVVRLHEAPLCLAVARIVLTMLRLVGAAAIFLQKYSSALEIIYLRPLR